MHAPFTIIISNMLLLLLLLFLLLLLLFLFLFLLLLSSRVSSRVSPEFGLFAC